MSEKVSAGHEAHGIDAMQGGAMLFDLVHAVADHASRPTDETAVRRMVGRAMRSTRVYRSGRYKTLLYKDLNYLNGMAMVLRERIELSPGCENGNEISHRYTTRVAVPLSSASAWDRRAVRPACPLHDPGSKQRAQRRSPGRQAPLGSLTSRPSRRGGLD